MSDLLFTPEMLEEEFRKAENDLSIKIKRVEYPESQKDLHGAHFAASVDFMNVVFTRNGNSKEETVPIFVKRSPKNETTVRDLQRYDIFKKEGEWYRTVSKKMLEFCEKSSPAIGQKLKSSFPVCYYTDANSVIVMEDLNKQNYKMHDYDMEVLQDVQHVKLVMEFYAVFHGVGYVMKKKDLLEDVKPFLNEVLFTKDSDFMLKYIDAFCTPALAAFANNSDEQKYYDILEKISKYSVNIIDQKFKPCEPFSVISHGDSWNNNILFKYGEDGKPSNVKLVDWPRICFCSMTVDLNYLFYSSTTSKFREKHLDEMLRYYFKKFISVVQELQNEKKPFNDFTFEELYEDFRDHNIVGFNIFIGMLAMTFTPKEGIEHTDDGTESLFDKYVTMTGNIFKNKENLVPIKRLIRTLLDEIGDNLLDVLK